MGQLAEVIALEEWRRRRVRLDAALADAQDAGVNPWLINGSFSHHLVAGLTDDEFNDVERALQRLTYQKRR